MERIEGKLDKSLQDMEGSKKQIIQLEEKNVKWSQRVEKLEEEVHMLKNKSVESENRSRETNLLFFGLNTTPYTKADECWDMVTMFLKREMQLENIFIDRAHIIGKSQRPPIIVKCPRTYDRTQILAKARTLRNSTISIAQDFAKETREARRELQ